MATDEKIGHVDLGSLEVLVYPNPRLREVCTPVAAVDDSVRRWPSGCWS